MVHIRSSYESVGLFDYLWQIVVHERKLNEILKKKLRLQCLDERTIKRHSENLSKSHLIERLDDVWQAYFCIGKGYSSSVYWSVYARNRFDFFTEFGIKIDKNNFRREHVVPKNVHSEYIFDLQDKNELIEYLLKNYVICVVTKEQDDELNGYQKNGIKLDKNMPDGWDWKKDGPWSRYNEVGIKYDLTKAPTTLTQKEVKHRLTYLSTIESLDEEFSKKGYLN